MDMRKLITLVEADTDNSVRSFQAGRDQHGRQLWFKLHYDANTLIGVEEHDSYQGGPIKMTGGSWENTFLERVRARAAPEYVEAAEEFLNLG